MTSKLKSLVYEVITANYSQIKKLLIVNRMLYNGRTEINIKETYKSEDIIS